MASKKSGNQLIFLTLFAIPLLLLSVSLPKATSLELRLERSKRGSDDKTFKLGVILEANDTLSRRTVEQAVAYVMSVFRDQTRDHKLQQYTLEPLFIELENSHNLFVSNEEGMSSLHINIMFAFFSPRKHR
ncbi:hypothetical protein Ciccas_011811 [Cichlidogyrus casuarinus]|uniref:Uncharacterized protein n=1 Tax=Cichlidogyrus casuarinus TaxID=1844966 RepID=A0ABD2PR30_9PLAT